MSKRVLFLILIVIAPHFNCAKHSHVRHWTEKTEWTYEQTDSLILERKIIEYAELLDNLRAESARYAGFDNALPANLSEYTNLNKNSILRIVAITRDKEELPIKNAYIDYSGRKVKLEEMLTTFTEVKDGIVKRVLGGHRQDFFYLFPIYLQLRECELLIDWNKNREAFSIGKFPMGIGLRFIVDDENVEDQNYEVKSKSLKEILRREFSVFIKSLVK